MQDPSIYHLYFFNLITYEDKILYEPRIKQICFIEYEWQATMIKNLQSFKKKNELRRFAPENWQKKKTTLSLTSKNCVLIKNTACIRPNAMKTCQDSKASLVLEFAGRPINHYNSYGCIDCSSF